MALPGLFNMNLIVGALLFLFLGLSHDDVVQRIQELTNQIALQPQDPRLHMERGELYLIHEEYQNALSDFSFCVDHDFKNVRVYMGMSKTHLYLDQPGDALIFVEKALTLDPKQLTTLELKATILSQLGRDCDAGSTMELLLTNTTNPSPILFLETSSYMESCDESGTSLNAIRILEDGIIRLGEIKVLQKRLINLYMSSKQYGEAIRVQTSIIEHSKLKIRPYFERAQLYVELQSEDKAKEDLTTALSLMNDLPDHKKSIASLANLKTEMSALLTELEK